MRYKSVTDDLGDVYFVVGEAELLIVVFLVVISDGAVMPRAQHSAMR